jgi:hypothetical protein
MRRPPTASVRCRIAVCLAYFIEAWSKAQERRGRGRRPSMPFDETEELVTDLEQVLVAGALMIAELVQAEPARCYRRWRRPLVLRVHNYLAHVDELDLLHLPKEVGSARRRAIEDLRALRGMGLGRIGSESIFKISIVRHHRGLSVSAPLILFHQVLDSSYVILGISSPL